MDYPRVQSRSPIVSKASSGPNSPSNLTRHQKSVSDSAAFKLSMLNTSVCSSSPVSPVGRSNPKRFSTQSDSSLRTDLSASSANETDSVSSYAGEPTPTRPDGLFRPTSPVLRTRQPIRTFSSPVQSIDRDPHRYQLSSSVPATFDAASPHWQLTDAMMRAHIADPRQTALTPPNSWSMKADEPSIYASPSASQSDAALDASLAAWQVHQLGLQHQLLRQYSRLQQQQAGDLRSHARSDSYQSTQSTDSISSAAGRLPSVLDAYASGIGMSPYLSSSLLARTPQLSSAQEIEAAEQELAREAAAYNARKADFKALLDAQSLQQAAITMAYTGQSHPLLSLYGPNASPEQANPGLSAAIARLVSLRAGEITGPSAANKKTNLYKTELCRSWEEKGSCRYGAKCQFAHGQDELRPVSRHPKFKTEICRTFWLHGSCPYGKRCCFLHTTANEGGGGSPSDPENATSRLQQRTSSGLTDSPEPRSRLERLRPVSASAATLFRSSPLGSLPKHFSAQLDRPASALSDRSSSFLTPFTAHRSAASSPTDSATLSATAQPFEVKAVGV